MERSDYSGFAKLLHWLIALLIAGMVGLGTYMTEVEGDFQYKLWLYQLHKSFGVTLFALLVVRLVWRQISPPPPMPATMPSWERRAAQTAHVALYVLMFAIPLSGWARVSASPLSIPTNVFGLFKLPHLPFLASLRAEQKEALEPVFQTVHWGLAWTLVAVVALHAAAALRHAFVLRDDVMNRMLPRNARRSVTPLALAALVLPLALSDGQAQAAQWTILAEESEIAFSGRAAGQTIEGKFERFSGSVRFDPEAPADTRAEVVIELDSLSTGNSDVDSTLPGESWFNTAEHPEAVFAADSAAAAEGESAYVLGGTLSLKGQTGEVDVPFTIDIANDTATASGDITINRLDYGIGPSGPISGITVAEDVTVSFRLRALKED